ncbi:MAG: histidine kinase, partial [Polyangiaceae bacterium]|nr:histidine kinase [Polyangiaceae bacterium]
MNWTFGRKLAAGFAAAVLTILVIGFAGHRATADLIENDFWVEHTYEVRQDLALLLSSLKDVETGQRGFLITGDEAFLEPYNAGLTSVARAQAEAKRLTADNEAQQKRLEQLAPIVAARLAVMLKVIEMRRTQGIDPIIKGNMLKEGKQHMDEIRRVVAELDETEVNLLDGRKQRARASAIAAQATILWGSIIGTALVALAGVVIARSLASQIGVAVRHIQTSAAELQAAANQQATGAKQQATAMTEITTTISELLATSRQIAESARRVSDIATQTATQARAGDVTVSRGTDAVGAIKRQVDAIVSHMLELGKKSQQIGAVLDIVSELAEQTNILAINATIEAAGAGEAGRRFGVVADEIRKLADRVGGSTKEIRGLIDDVRAAVNTTVMTTETGSKAVEAGADQF